MEILYFIGTASFALSGYIIGVKKEFDLLGIFILSIITAVGGGIIRDALVNRVPLVFYDYTPVIIIVSTIFVAWILRIHRRGDILRNNLFILSDSVGLVSFSIAGASVGLEFHLNFFGVVFLSFITAIGGGIVRDMMVNDVPFILSHDFYGTVSILVGGVLYFLDRAGYATLPVLYLLFGLGLVLRLIAHFSEFRLPRI